MTTRVSTAQQLYLKSHILEGLEKYRQQVIDATQTYEEKLKEWKDTIVQQFTEFVAGFEPGEGSYGEKHNKKDMREFAPPVLKLACQDWRVQALNKSLARVEALAADDAGRVKLRSDDQVFTYLGVDIDCE